MKIIIIKEEACRKTSLGSSSTRKRISAQRSGSKQLLIEGKHYWVNKWYREPYESHFVELTVSDYKIEASTITFCKVGYDAFYSKSLFKYSSLIFDHSTFKIWNGDEYKSLETIANIVNGRKFYFFHKVIKILEYLKV